uniref:Uncharacterized protein n=1 Tax=Heterorhabditis bacteriophora TaxID=37862 RepID=A0A1I7X5A3_HETBA
MEKQSGRIKKEDDSQENRLPIIKERKQHLILNLFIIRERCLHIKYVVYKISMKRFAIKMVGNSTIHK